MCRRLLLALIVATIAWGAPAAGPSEFYVVSVFFSDNGALYYYRVIDVQPDGPDSVIRYTRIAPANVYCPRWIVQSATARLRGLSPSGLVRNNNPCAVKSGTLHSALRQFHTVAGGFEIISFGIVARCGFSTVVLDLPEVDLERAQKTKPEVARLWRFMSEITDGAFGSTDIFHDRTEEDDLVLQRAGEKELPELVSGRYDIGLAAAFKRNVGSWRSPSFRVLLENYRGPVNEKDAKSGFVPQLVNAQAYKFEQYIDPTYPPLAKQARIQGRVDLQLSVDDDTRAVKGVTVVSGHPLLRPSAIEAAKQWRFTADSPVSQVVNVTLDYALRCQ